MNSSEAVNQQRQKEGKALKVFLVSSLVGSLAFHAVAMTFKVGNLWNPLPTDQEDEMELIVEDVPTEEPVPEQVAEVEPPPEPEAVPEEVAFAPEIAPPPPLAPDSQAPQPVGEDAPSDQPNPPTDEAVQPMTGDAGTEKVQVGGGPIFKPFGTGSGFGNASRPTGFNPLGKPGGDPKGQPGGTAVRTAPPPPPAKPARPKEPVCISCPKPKYQGSEASPRVDMEVQPDGSVKVRLRKSSGNPDLDRATLETMSKWRFDPKTVPEEGVRKRVRVTYEEEGSNFQRQNEQRRRQEARQRKAEEQRQRAEEERRQAEERKRTPAAATVDTPASPTTASPPPPASSPAAAEKPATPPPEPAPAPVIQAAPPIEVPPAPPAPEFFSPPEPAPVEPPPAAVEPPAAPAEN